MLRFDESVAAKAYARLVIFVCPKSGEMVNWRSHLGLVALAAGGYYDDAEVDWLAECSTKHAVDVAYLSSVGNDQSDRWWTLDYALAKVAHGILKNSGAGWFEVVALKARDSATGCPVLKGRELCVDDVLRIPRPIAQCMIKTTCRISSL